IANARASIEAQASQIEKNLHADPEFVKSYENNRKNAEANGETFVSMKDREIVALIAYLQRLGTDIKVKEVAENK
ncbi:cbb3-type cytochrome c oxidase subunit II, partial [Arthrospira platensis SPKY1]|nr:cbb3-type cytochrome c oxidase subunit II [Arthrospira platensis SPKY1]